MCRHICPVGNATGQERNTSRARALGLSLVARDAVEYSEDIINNVYECALCGACVKECVTGWDPVMFTKEARLGAAMDGKLPDYILKLIENLQKNGSIYDAPKMEVPSMPDSDTLLFLGDDALHKAPECAKMAIEVLQKLGVEFTVLQNEPNSGHSMDFLVGAAAETKAVMENCAKVLSKYKKVICYDGADAKVMKREYKEWGIALDAEVVTFTSFLAEVIGGKVKNSGMKLTPQDSALLSRDLEETQPIRDILSACGEVSEMLNHGKDTMLAGNLIMNEYMPDVMERVASDRWQNAENVNAKVVVTESVAEYVMLKKTKPENIKLMTVEEVVAQCL